MRTRSPLERLIDLRRMQREAVEAEIERLEARRASSRRRAAIAVDEARELARSTVSAKRISGADLRAAAHWKEHLGHVRDASLAAEGHLRADAEALIARVLGLRREEKLLETAQDRRQSVERENENKRQSQLADELFLAKKARERLQAARAPRCR